MCEFGRVDISNVFHLCLSFIFCFFSSSICFVCLFPKVSLSTDYHFTLSTYCNFGIFLLEEEYLVSTQEQILKRLFAVKTNAKVQPSFSSIFFSYKKVLLHSLRNTKESISSLKIKLSVNKRTISNKRKQKDLESLSYSFLAFLPI